MHALLDHVVERLEREVGVDRARTVADEQRHVVHLARIAGFEDERAPRAHALAHQVVVHAGRREQAGNRRQIRAHAAVRQDQDRVTGVDRFLACARSSSIARSRPAPPSFGG